MLCLETVHKQRHSGMQTQKKLIIPKKKLGKNQPDMLIYFQYRAVNGEHENWSAFGMGCMGRVIAESCKFGNKANSVEYLSAGESNVKDWKAAGMALSFNTALKCLT